MLFTYQGDAGTRASDLDRNILQAHTEVRVQKERVAELSSEVAELRRHSATLEEEKRRLLEQAGHQKSATRDSQDKHTQALQACISIMYIMYCTTNYSRNRFFLTISLQVQTVRKKR